MCAEVRYSQNARGYKTDETFIVLEGKLHIDFSDGEVTLAAGCELTAPGDQWI